VFNLDMSVKCGVHIFSGLFGSSGSAVDQSISCFCEVWGSYFYRLVLPRLARQCI